MSERPELSDTELLRAHVDGDSEAFGELVRRHRDRMWAVALRTSRDPEEAADGLQDAILAAYRRAASFRGEAQVSTWLHRIVVNACLDRHRRNAVRRADPLPDDLDERAAAPATVDPAALLLDAERRRRVHDALRRLPEDQRIALVLVDLEQWPVAEVAERLGVATGTVKSRCSRGRARLAALLADLAPLRTEDQRSGTAPAPGASQPRPAVRRAARPGGEHP